MERKAKQSRPQLVCILADNSGSMAGEKAKAATDGIREMIMECQAKGPEGPDRSYFKLLLIRFDDAAVVDPACDAAPVRHIYPDKVEITGDGGMTNITAALQLALDRLRPYMDGLRAHPERAEHPLPVVLLFSDGDHNVGPGPEGPATDIRNLDLDGEHVVIATAGVSVGEDKPDEATLSGISSPGCYLHITTARELTRFISAVGSSGLSRAKDIAAKMSGIEPDV